MEQVFALDVGTRKVAGLLASAGPGGARVDHLAVREHSFAERAMLDGQVHFIEKAAQAVIEVRRDLEAQSGLRLREAHVAVAGRNLRTVAHRLEARLDARQPLSREQVLALELEAVREARTRLNDPRASLGSYCVGYSVSSLTLDGVELAALEGHAGERVEISVLATFLPKVVLDSLAEVLKIAGLDLKSLTLEPIAAAAVALPSDLRRLNLAMVDVGAGTSDIALTRGGRVEAFAMVELAGDEITERLAEAFLLDFGQAEALKRADPESIGVLVTDLFGNTRMVQPAQVWAEAEPALRRWADETAARILELNGGPPQAVLLVGGGSQCPNMDLFLAERLGLAPARVGRRPAHLQRAFVELPEALKSAWAITPLGIAHLALERRGLPFAQFRVNGARVQVLNLNQAFTVFDALVAAGRELSELHGRPGAAITFEFNGQLRVRKGGPGRPARVLVNGAETSLDAPIRPGDSVEFIPAQAGEDGKALLSQVLAEEGVARLAFEINGETRPWKPEVLVNGVQVEGDVWLQDRDRVEVRFEAPLARILEAEGCDLGGLISRSIAVSVNGEPRVITQRNYRLSLNGREVPLEAVARHSDRIEFEPGIGFQERVRDLLPGLPPRPRVKVRVNGEWKEVYGSAPRVLMNGREVSPDEFLIDGAEIRVLAEERRVSVVELLAQLPFDSARLQASSFELKVNGKAAPFNAILEEGDEVEVRFEPARRAQLWEV